MGLDGFAIGLFFFAHFSSAHEFNLFIQMLRGSWRHAPDRAIGRMTSRNFLPPQNHQRIVMTNQKMSLSAFLLAIATLAVGPFRPSPPHPPHRWVRRLLAVLSAAPAGGGAVTCTDSTITGNVGSSGAAASVVQTGARLPAWSLHRSRPRS
jgi:hypothetical protein